MIETTRHNEVFNYTQYRDKKICLIGAGAIGSRVFENLISTGLTNIRVIDFDKVESHNLANQLFIRADIDQLKVDALKVWAAAKTGDMPDFVPELEYRSAEVQKGMDKFIDAEIVISCVDSFAARYMLFNMALNNYSAVFFDTRMASNNGEIHTVDLSDTKACDVYKATIGDDDDPRFETSACGGSLTVGATAQMVGATCAWSLMTYLRDGFIDPYVRVMMQPMEVMR